MKSKQNKYKIESYIKGVPQRYEELYQAIGMDMLHPFAVSFVGAGGKTTSIQRILQESAEKQRYMVAATTTHVQFFQTKNVLLEESIEKLHELLKKYYGVWVGNVVSSEKIGAVSDLFLQKIMDENIPLLIEADGAKRMPCKAPKEGEPVIWSGSTCVVNVYGMDAIGKKIEEICFRKNQVETILQKTGADRLEESDLVKLALSENAGRKGIEEKEYQIILNKADAKKQRNQAADIAKELAKKGVQKIHITGYDEL